MPGKILSLIGPLAFAAANLIMTALLQRTSDAGTFGLYAFSQLAIATGIGISGGVFGSPAVVALAAKDAKVDQVLGSFLKANLVYCFAGALALSGLLVAATAATDEVMMAGVLGILMWMRAFIRSLSLGLHRYRAASLSDGLYGAAAGIGVLLLYLFNELNFFNALVLQCVCAALAHAPILETLRESFKALATAPFRKFQESFREHGSWATVVVVATEVVANAHSYAITLIWGPAAFAPIALATLLFRPVGVVLTALVQFERPRMALKANNNDVIGLNKDIRFIQFSTISIWFVVSIFITVIILIYPHSFLTGGYELQPLLAAFTITALVVLARLAKEPVLSALQASSQFKTVAKVGVACASITLILVGAILVLTPNRPELSLTGALIGELLNFVLLSKILKQRYSGISKDSCQ